MQREEHVVSLINSRRWDEIAREISGATLEVPIEGAQRLTWGIPESYRGDVTLLGCGATRRVLWATSLDGLPYVVRAVARKHLGTHVIWIHEGDQAITFLFGDGVGRCRRITFDPKQSHAITAARISCLMDSDDAAVERAFEAEEITRRFFSDFRDVFHRFTDAMIDGPVDPDRRRDLALTWLLRVVFLYFLQTKGALDGDRQFLARQVSVGENLHETFWSPLFFGVLNKSRNHRDRYASGFGEIPYLNGGLFEKTALETSFTDARLADDVWREAIHEFFERYYFVVRDVDSDDEVCAVDPEMLGKVFESLMATTSRKRSGAFYTPREVVREIVDNVLSRQLVELAGVGDVAALSDPENQADVASAVREIRVLDPAVGTGAFLMASLEYLVEVRRTLGLSVGATEVQAIIRDCLFGVDINPTAIRICELRFWLRILVSHEGDAVELDPLPNLSHRFVAGDSLLDPIDTHAPTSATYKKLAGRFRKLQRIFFNAHGEEKRDALHALETARADVFERTLMDARRFAVQQKAALIATLTQEDLFGHAMELSAKDRDALRAYDEQLESVDRQLELLRRDELAPEFSYATHFPRVMRDGGFHVVVTNPPWVRHHALDPDRRAFLKARYRTSRPQLWSMARDQGVRPTFGGQPELANLFVERSLELVRPGGRVAALVPAKMFRSLQGSATRELLARHDVESVRDSTLESEKMFHATTYPARFQVRKSRATPLNSRLSPVFGDDPKAPWHLGDSDVGQLLNRVASAHSPLGSFSALSPRRGFFTGANDVFVKPAGEFEKILGTDAFVWPVQMGRRGAYEVLLPYHSDGTVVEEPSNAVVSYFESFRETLERRSGFDPSQPLWQVFRMHAEHFGRKVLWRDMSVVLEVCSVGEGTLPINTTYYISVDDLAFEQRLVTLLSSPLPQAFARVLCERARGGWRRHFAWSIQCIPIPDAFFRSTSKSPRSDTIRRWYGISESEEQRLLDFVECSVGAA